MKCKIMGIAMIAIILATIVSDISLIQAQGEEQEISDLKAEISRLNKENRELRGTILLLINYMFSEQFLNRIGVIRTWMMCYVSGGGGSEGGGYTATQPQQEPQIPEKEPPYKTLPTQPPSPKPITIGLPQLEQTNKQNISNLNPL